jgi:hypothetical protein
MGILGIFVLFAALIMVVYYKRLVAMPSLTAANGKQE